MTSNTAITFFSTIADLPALITAHACRNWALMTNEERLMHYLWLASKPAANEHRIAFTLNLTTLESDRLKGKGSEYITEALRTVRNLLEPFHPKDIVVIVEQNQPDCGHTVVPHDLHLHGWIKIDKTVTKKVIHEALTNKRTSKINAKNGFCFKDKFRPKWNSTGPSGPVTVGWLDYIVKQFDEQPIDCGSASHMFSASKDVKRRATAIRTARMKKFRPFRRNFIRANKPIEQSKGDWKYWSDAYDECDPDIPDQNDPQYH